jgi:Leucine-rich repeat (LRR) protein
MTTTTTMKTVTTKDRKTLVFHINNEGEGDDDADLDTKTNTETAATEPATATATATATTTAADFVIDREDYREMLQILACIREQAAEANRDSFPADGSQYEQLRRWLRRHPDDTTAIRELVKTTKSRSKSTSKRGNRNDHRNNNPGASTSTSASAEPARVRVLSLPTCALRLPVVATIIPDLETLKVLRLDSISSIEGLSSWIGKMSNLVSLEICNNYSCFDLSTFPREEVGNLIRLRKLFLKTTVHVNRNNGIEIENGNGTTSSRSPLLPPSLWKLINLTTLHLSLQLKRGRDDEGFHIPDDIGNLTQLEKLVLYESSVLSLPSTIHKLTNLKTLNLVKTRKLHSLPDEIGDLIHLEELNLRCSSVSELPASMMMTMTMTRKHCRRRCHRLKTLSLYEKNANHFLLAQQQQDDDDDDDTESSSFAFASSLEELHVGHADMIERLPPWIGHFRHLRKLVLFDLNQLYYLPNEIGTLIGLECLGVCATALVCLPKSIGNLQNLKELTLLFNKQLQSLSDGFYQLTKLEKVTIRESKLIASQEDVFPKILRHLFEKCTLSLVHLDFSGCNISRIDPFVSLPTKQAFPRRLKKLDLSSNPILGGGSEESRRALIDLVVRSPVLVSLGLDARLQKPAYEELRSKLRLNRMRVRILSCFETKKPRRERDNGNVNGNDDGGGGGGDNGAAAPRALLAFVLSNARAVCADRDDSYNKNSALYNSYSRHRNEEEEDANAIYALLNGCYGADVPWHGGVGKR